MVIWLVRAAFWKVRWWAKKGAQVSVDGLLCLWAEGLCKWLNAGSPEHGSNEIKVFLAVVRTMVATGSSPR